MKTGEIKPNGQRRAEQSSDGKLSIHVPYKMARRSGRKLVKSPTGEACNIYTEEQPTVFQMSLARGHRWAAMFESGEFASLKDIAKYEGIDKSYISRMINLTTLAPDIVEAILDDNMDDDLTILELAVNPPALWEDQLRAGYIKQKQG